MHTCLGGGLGREFPFDGVFNVSLVKSAVDLIALSHNISQIAMDAIAEDLIDLAIAQARL
jgi:hypothetical protein